MQIRRIIKGLTKHIIVTMMSFSVVAIVVFFAYNISFLSPIANALDDFSLSDIIYDLQKNSVNIQTSRSITIVDMTPLNSRREIAAYIDTIQSMKPDVLGVDILFEGFKEDVEGDMRIMEVATNSEYKNMVFAYKLYPFKDPAMPERKETHSFFVDENIKVNEGFSDIQRNLYGGIKRYFLTGWGQEDTFRPSIITAIANKYSDGAINYRRKENVLINYTPTIFPKIRYDSIKYHPDLIENRTVLFGGLKDETDMHYTPLGKKAGIELLAYALNTLYNKQVVREVPFWLLCIISFIFVFIAELYQCNYERVIRHLFNEVWQHLLTSSFFVGLITIPFIIFTVFLSLHCLNSHHLYADAGYAIAAMVFLDSCRDFYNICEESWIKRNSKKK